MSYLAQKQWTIVGTGAMARLWAGALCHADSDVTLLSRHAIEPSIASLAVASPVLGPQSKQFDIHLSHRQQLASGSIDRLIIATKAYDAQAALQGLLPALTPTAKVLTLCNGIGFQSTLAALLEQQHPQASLWLGISSDGAFIDDTVTGKTVSDKTFAVTHTGAGHTYYGVFRGDANNDAALLDDKALFLQCSAVDDIHHYLWRKALVNCAINPLTVKHRVCNGELRANDRIYSELLALCNELTDIYNAAINHLPELAGRSALGEQQLIEWTLDVVRQTAANTSSMLRDAQQGRPLELDYLNQYMIQLASDCGVDCPINRQLVAGITANLLS